MPSLAEIANLPSFSSGYEGAKARNQQQGAAELQQAGGLMAILAKVKAAKKEQEFRGALDAAKTPEEQAAVAARFGTPGEVLTHSARTATASNTKQIALQNLQQKISTEMRHVYEFAQTLPLKERQIALAEAQANATNLWRSGSLQIQKGNLDYNVGGDTSAIGDVISRLRSGGAAAPAAAPAMGSTPQPQPGTPEYDAFQAVASGRTPTAYVGSGPVPAPQPVPVPAPQPQPEPMPAPQNNLDARDLGAGARGPVMGSTPLSAPVAAPVAASVAPAPLVMPPEIASAPRKVQDAWKLAQTKPSIAGGGMMSPEVLEFTAQQYLTGDRQAAQGYARSATLRAALQTAIVQEAKKQGMSGPDVAAKMSEFAGIMAGSRSVGVRAAQIELASSEAIKMIDIVKEQSKKFSATEFVPWNRALKAFDTQTGQPEVRAYGASINSLVNVYARAINPVGQPTISDKDHARELLQVIDSQPQVDAVLDVLKQEMSAARSAPEDVRASLRNAVLGNAKRRESDKNPTVVRKYNPATRKIE